MDIKYIPQPFVKAILTAKDVVKYD